MGSTWRDFRYGLRMLARVPGHTLAAVLALAQGIGLTTATFSIVYGSMVRGLPFTQAERLMSVRARDVARDQEGDSAGIHDYLEWCRGAARLAAGVLLGLPAAFGVSQLLGGVLYDVRPGDPAVFGLVVVTLSLVAMVATLVPAQRALEVEPIVALRHD